MGLQKALSHFANEIGTQMLKLCICIFGKGLFRNPRWR